MHRAATIGYQRQSEAYNRGRPTYHPALAQRIADAYPPTVSTAMSAVSEQDPGLVELGAGTGIFTAQLAALDLRVTAVEPVEAMRVAMQTMVGQRYQGLIDTVDGTAEQLPFADGSVQTVVASQSFHWFHYAAALDEAARVLCPGGHLVTVWNVRDNQVPWVSAYTAVIDRHAEDTPRHHTMRWRQAIDDDSRFRLVEDFSIANPYPTTPDGVSDRVRSTSFIGALDPEQQAAVLADIARIVAPLGERFDYPYNSELQAWRRN